MARFLALFLLFVGIACAPTTEQIHPNAGDSGESTELVEPAPTGSESSSGWRYAEPPPGASAPADDVRPRPTPPPADRLADRTKAPKGDLGFGAELGEAARAAAAFMESLVENRAAVDSAERYQRASCYLQDCVLLRRALGLCTTRLQA